MNLVNLLGVQIDPKSAFQAYRKHHSCSGLLISLRRGNSSISRANVPVLVLIGENNGENNQ
jgi:hypothetical protein